MTQLGKAGENCRAMTLDPIVSFSVAVAEAPGSYAFFLGSGVSRDAGVPTGGQVFWQAVGELYRLEKKTEETPGQEALAEWLKETKRDGLNYSGLLELIAPDQATRRDYLAKHFEGREPGPTHERLAQLVEQGYIRVFITTNFDRLLENALKARGIEPVVITSAAELRSAPRREHAPCYVFKPHGDYLQETIRNTPDELEKLEPGITKELCEIFERFGIVVLGYSGSDEAIAATLRSRRSRYGLYWVARSKLGGGAERIVEVAGGRVIKRDGAAEFLADLQRRLEVFKSHPSGHTPVEVHDEVLALIRSGDNVGLAEVMRRERREFSDGLSGVIASHRELRPSDEGNLLSAHDQILPLLERRLASLLPVIAYAPEAFAQEVRSLTDLLESQPLEGGYTAWPELADWTTWWLGYACGAFALLEEAWVPLGNLLQARYTNRREKEDVPLVTPWRESVGNEIGQYVMAKFSSSNWLVPRWEHLVWSLRECEVIQERWPEFLRGEKGPRPALSDFDFLVTLYEGIQGGAPLAHWTMGDMEGVRPARRIRNDPRYRSEAAQAFGLDAEVDLVEIAPEALSRLQRVPGSWGGDEAIRALVPEDYSKPQR
jgi:hypothetical protein